MSLLLCGLALVVGLVVGLAVVGLWLWWLHLRLARLPAWRRGVRRVVAVLLGLGPVLFVAAEGYGMVGDPAPVRPLLWLGLTWAAFAFYLTLLTGVLSLVSLVLRLRAGGPAQRRRLHRVGAPAAVALALTVTGYGLHEAGDVRVVPVTVADPALPASWDGARVVFLTDLHLGPVRDADFARRLVDLVQAQQPDLVLLGGDLVDGPERYVGEYLEPLADLDAPLGVYGVTGNHEFLTREAGAYLRRWESLGITPLRNEHVELVRGGAADDPVTLAGVHDVEGTGAEAPDPDAALAGVDPGSFVLWLAHEPRQAEPDRGLDLQLSGHTHGGQLWPFGWLVGLQQPTLAGLDEVDGVRVLTSRGAGAWGPPVRVLAPPEITVVTLSTAPAPAPGARVRDG